MRTERADQLERLADELCRLRPDRKRPEAYFERKSSIEAELRRLAREEQHARR
jgi:hypothetical protein